VTDARQLALDILRRAASGRDTRRGGLRTALHDTIVRHSLSGQDAGLLTEIVYGATRHSGSIDAVIAAFSRAPMRKLDKRVHAALRLGLYQIIYLDRVPDSAAVDETVKTVKRVASPRSAGFVNGLLRSVCRAITARRVVDPPVGDRPRAIHARDDQFIVFNRNLLPRPDADPARWIAGAYSMPAWLAERWLERLGPAEAEQACAASNAAPRLFLRTNLRRVTRDELRDELATEGVQAEACERPECVDLGSGIAIGRVMRLLDHGLCSVQDHTAMQVAPRLDPQPGERILELCAAPGGKTTHLAELTGDRAPVVAVDTDAASVGKIADNARRLGLKSITCIRADATDAPLRGEFDKVLLDVPCSNTGVLARRADARWRLQRADLDRLTQLQTQLLRAASNRVRAGGVLVYSTCSTEPEENRRLVESFLGDCPAFELAEDEELLPHRVPGDGGYVAKLVRR